MNLRSLFRWAMLVAVSAALIAIVTLAGITVFVFYTSNSGQNWSVPVSEVSDTLSWDGKEYIFSGEELLAPDRWAMLMDERGQVVWSYQRPEDVPEQYTITDVASFTRWYLNDYPVQCWVREDGLLVVGASRGSIWKHDMSMRIGTLVQTPLWFGGIFLLALGCVLILAYRVVRRWFLQAQQVRDAARSDWINGVSHDIRTPLSVVMGYAAQLEGTPGLPPEQKRQATAIRAQSQVIRDLVNDLNLTMRLDCAMQPLRKEPLRPEVFLRQIAADFLNGGMGEGFDLDMDLRAESLPQIEADPFLLRRAVNNLLTNCVRHNAPGCSIRLGARAEGNQVILFVEGGTMAGSLAPTETTRQLDPDGGAVHGTGLKLVSQIAAAHGGKAEFRNGTPFLCELWLSVKQLHE